MKYFFIAGEASGDSHAAKVLEHLLRLDHDANIQFWGGDRMAKVLGKQPLKHIKELAFMGFVEVIKNIFTIKKNFNTVQASILDFATDVLVLVDYPGFNLRMAKWAKKHGIKVIYYVSPTVWAWHQSRVFQVKKYVDEMLVILPFEQAFYQKFDIDVHYVGNPVLDDVEAFQADPTFREKHQLQKPFVALAPGSRVQEIERILPSMLKALKTTGLKGVIAKAPNINASLYENIIKEASVEVLILEQQYYNIMRNAAAAMVTSGTATLETGLLNCPQVVCYKATPLSFFIAKSLVDIKYISLVNLICDQALVKELIQGEMTVEAISKELNRLVNLSDQERNDFYAPLFRQIGESGASKRVAERIVKFVAATSLTKEK